MRERNRAKGGIVEGLKSALSREEPLKPEIERAIFALIDYHQDKNGGGLSNKKLAEILGCSRKRARKIRKEVARVSGLRYDF